MEYFDTSLILFMLEIFLADCLFGEFELILQTVNNLLKFLNFLVGFFEILSGILIQKFVEFPILFPEGLTFSCK